MAALKFAGISVATVGPALGHEMFVDDVTLLQAEQAGVAGSPVKVFVDHDESIDSLIGFLSGFRIEEDQLRADLELLSAHPQAEFYAEILTKAPGRVGFSMTFSGKPEEVGDQRLARVENLVSVDLVSRPAANPDGVFKAGKVAAVDIEPVGMDEQNAPQQFDAKAAIENLAAELRAEIAAALAEKAEAAQSEEVSEEAPVVEAKAEEPAVESEALAALSAKVAELEVALAAKGSAPVASSGAASEDPVEQFKAASESKDWKRCASIFKAHKAAIMRARNQNNF
jgi:hypothetical protein